MTLNGSGITKFSQILNIEIIWCLFGGLCYSYVIINFINSEFSVSRLVPYFTLTVIAIVGSVLFLRNIFYVSLWLILHEFTFHCPLYELT